MRILLESGDKIKAGDFCSEDCLSWRSIDKSFDGKIYEYGDYFQFVSRKISEDVVAQNSTSINKSSFQFPELEEVINGVTIPKNVHMRNEFLQGVQLAYNFIVGNKKR